jgi:hypothetical protein
MLYLIIFSALALGFYTQSTLSVQVSSSERRLNESQAAAESGLQYMRYWLSTLDVPGDKPKDKVLEEVYQELAGQLETTGSLRNPVTGVDQLLGWYALNPKPPAPQNPYAISVPAAPGFIWLQKGGPGFRAIITESNRQLTVRVIGQAGGSTIAKAIEVKFDVTRHTSDSLKFGVASKGTVTIDVNAKLLGVNSLDGNMLITATTNPALTMGSNTAVSGEISFTQANPLMSVASSASIYGTTAPGIWGPHVLKAQTAPEFPQINTEDFLPFVLKADGTKNYYTGGTVLKNVVLKANQTYNFSGGETFQGVLYIETPCIVNFSGGVNLQGVMVAQTPTTGSILTNQINISGNCTFQGVETLPATADFPPELRAMTGSQMILPKFKFTCTGNFTSMGGSIAADQISFDGSSSGTIKGSLINLSGNPVLLSGKTLTIDHTSVNKYPAGILFGHHYSPKPGSYMEVNPWN